MNVVVAVVSVSGKVDDMEVAAVSVVMVARWLGG